MSNRGKYGQPYRGRYGQPYLCEDCGKTEPRLIRDDGLEEFSFKTVRRHMEKCEWQETLQTTGEPRQRFDIDGKPCCWNNYLGRPPCKNHE